MSSQSLSLGPKVEGRGEGSRIVRWRVPPFTPPLTGVIVVVVGNIASFIFVVKETVSGWGWEIGGEIKVRWHSLSMRGMEDAGRRAGRLNAWIEEKMFEA